MACTNPAGVAGELIFNADHKVLQYCDGDDWIGMGWKEGRHGPVGNEGEIQFKGADGYLTASSNLAYNSTNRHLLIAGGSYTFWNPFIRMQTEQVNDSGTLGSASTGGGRGDFHIHACNSASTGNCSIYFHSKETRVMTILSNGNVGIGVDTPTDKLHVNGNIKIEPGFALKMDVIRITANPRTSPMTIDPDGTGVTCTHVSTGSIHTKCACPTGYIPVSGGGHMSATYGSIRENRFLAASNEWIVSCNDTAGAPAACYSLEMICMRIIPNS